MAHRLERRVEALLAKAAPAPRGDSRIYCAQEPTPPQAAFLALEAVEALYGGAAGGGKSSALLMAALQHVHVPGYSAILFRRTFADLALPGALIPRSHEWLAPTDASWSDQTKTWRFPSGATLSFGYLENENNKYRYQGSEFSFIGWDELTQFSETQYRYLFSRLRKRSNINVPLRMRGASNPGGIGHEWVKRRFIDESAEGRVFVPARLDDNPFLDREEYEKALANLDPVTRQQLRNGDWTIKDKGAFFDRAWFEIVEPENVPPCQWVRFWDMAATEAKAGKDPDWTVGAKVGVYDGMFYVANLRRHREKPARNEEIIRQTAQEDGREVDVWMEQEPGSAGVTAIDHYARHVLAGFTFFGERSTGNKASYAKPLSAAAQRGNVKLVRGPWISEFLDECEAFPNGLHDDQVDAVSKGVAKLSPFTDHKLPDAAPAYGTPEWSHAEEDRMRDWARSSVQRNQDARNQMVRDFGFDPSDDTPVF